MSANHGSTPAAWIAVAIVLIAFLVGGLGLVFENMLVFWIGVALAPIGGIVGLVLSKTRLGNDVHLDPVQR
jgi:hypothetical protein